MYNQNTLKYLESKMPHLFINGKLMNEDKLPTFAQDLVDSFIASQNSINAKKIFDDGKLYGDGELELDTEGRDTAFEVYKEQFM